MSGEGFDGAEWAPAMSYSLAFRYRVLGGHVHVRGFMGRDAEHRGKIGDLVFTFDEWDVFRQRLDLAGRARSVQIEFIDDAAPAAGHAWFGTLDALLGFLRDAHADRDTRGNFVISNAGAFADSLGGNVLSGEVLVGPDASYYVHGEERFLACDLQGTPTGFAVERTPTKEQP